MAVDRIQELHIKAGVQSSLGIAHGKSAGHNGAVEALRCILVADKAVEEAMALVQQKVKDLQELCMQAKDSFLPTEVQQVEVDFVTEDLLCVQLLQRVELLIASLRRASDAKGQGPDSYTQVRENLADRRAKDLKLIVHTYFKTHQQYHELVRQRFERQLKFTYPDATEAEVQEALRSPSWSAAAISRRLEEGDDCPPLGQVINDVVKSDGNVALLAEGAASLKAMFLQFSQLVDVQGGTLTQIESHIQKTMQTTEETVEILHDAAERKRQIQSAQMRMRVAFICFFFIVLVVIWLWLNCPGLETARHYFHSVNSSKPMQHVHDFFSSQGGKQPSQLLQQASDSSHFGPETCLNRTDGKAVHSDSIVSNAAHKGLQALRHLRRSFHVSVESALATD